MTTEVENQTIQEFLIKHPVEIELAEVPENPTMEKSDEMLNYHVTLKHEDRVMKLYFSTGAGWVERRPLTKAEKPLPAPLVYWDKKRKKFIKRELGGRAYEADEGTFTRYRIKKPTAADVLDCLASDASGADQDFESWAGDLGYDTDSRSAERTYRTIQKQVKELRRLLGHAAFDELLNQTERL